MPHIHTSPGQVDYTVEVFVVCGRKVLLRKHDKYNIWLSVGGHIELGEDPNQAAVREVKEEVGLSISLHSPAQIPNFAQDDYRELIPPVFLNRHRISADHEHVTATYFATTDADNIKPENPTDVWRWFTREDLERQPELLPSIRHYALTALAALSA